MNPDHTRKLLGGAAVLLGLWWTLTAVFPLIRMACSDGFETGNIVFLLTIGTMMAIPGVLAVVYGVRLFREMREASLKWVIGVSAVFFAFFLSSRLSAVFPEFLSEELRRGVFLFVASMLAIVAYLLAVRLLLRHFTQKEHSLTSLVSRGPLILLAWQLWSLLTKISDEYSPIEEGYTHIHKEPWESLGFLMPVIVAYGLYRILASRLTKAQQAAPSNGG